MKNIEIMFPKNNNEMDIDQQLYDILHPERYDQNFLTIDSFENYLMGFVNNYGRLLLVPTLKSALKQYEEYEGYEQCIILMNIIGVIRQKQKNSKAI